MNSLVSLLPSAGNSPATANAARLPAAPRSGESAQPFSSALDQAVDNSSERSDAAAKPNRGRRPDRDDAGEGEVRSERREPTRAKGKSNQRDEDQSLAGAAAVTGQPPKTETLPITGSGRSDAENAEAAIALGVTIGIVGTKVRPTGEQVLPGRAGAKAGGVPVNASIPSTPIAPTENLETALKPATVAVEQSMPVMGTKGMVQPDAPVAAGSIGTTDSPAPTSVITAVAAAMEPAPEAPTTETDLASAMENVVATETEKEFAPPSEQARHVSRQARRAWAEALENGRGIGSAKSIGTMNTANNREEIAGLSPQLVPGSSGLPGSTLSNLPGDVRLGAVGGNASLEALNAAARLNPGATRADLSGAGEPLEVRPPSPLVRTSELISREVQMFKRGGDDLVEVVLTPDARTQISLRLQWREGQVEVQARCDLGDHHALNLLWSQLQNAMAQHGVRLSHLTERAPTGFTEFFNNPSFSQQHGERRSAAHSGGAIVDLPAGAPAGKTGATVSGVRSNRLLESWA